MKVLFITHTYPNYVVDLLLHGLRKLLGENVVDYPRKDCVYEGVLGLGICPPEQRSNNWFPDDTGIDRQDIETKLATGFFDYVVSDIRNMELANKLLNGAKYKGLAIIDGEDHPVNMTPGPFLFFQRETDGTQYGIPLPMSMPEEILLEISEFKHEPKRYSIGFIGSLSDQEGYREKIVHSLMKHFPDGLFKLSGIASQVEQSPQGRLGKKAYYQSLQQCEMLLTLRGAGFDTFRYWEHMACHAVSLVEKMPLFVPYAFKHDVHQQVFSSEKQLITQVESLLSNKQRLQEIMTAAREKLIKSHLTIHRAKYLIDRLQMTYR